jgi:tRNA nucleotidyltransferase (CCA-adding enzyme)
MKIYLVGGAVRDELLNRPVKEKDWVVVGATQTDMLAAGYQQVGKDFPVFLHPKTKEEYALARKERKVAKGYHGFEFDVTASVTLEEDLLRRDLTINAIAKDEFGDLMDPYHGVNDLNEKTLRHVSPAFAEDPVRILRVARFAARFSDFTVAAETNALMKKMVQQGEVNALVAERVWKEFETAMSEVIPSRFFEVLDGCDALHILFPLFKKHRQSVFDCLRHVSSLTLDAFERIVLVLQSTQSQEDIKLLFGHYRPPKAIIDMVNLLLKNEKFFKKIPEKTPEEMLNFLNGLDAFRRPNRFKHWLNLNNLNQNISQEKSDFLLKIFYCIEKIELPDNFLVKHQGKAIGEYIQNQRLLKLEKFLS